MTTMLRTSIISMNMSNKIYTQPDDHVKSHKSSSDKTHQEGRDESKRSNHSQSTQDMLFTEEDSLPEREIDHAFRKKYRIVRFLGHGASANVYLIKEKIRKRMMERYVREQRHNAAYAKTIPPVQPITPSPSLDCLATMG
eukprot:gene6927-7662_t